MGVRGSKSNWKGLRGRLLAMREGEGAEKVRKIGMEPYHHITILAHLGEQCISKPI